MTAGSSGIMIDALGWHLGLLLLFGACLEKGEHQSSSRAGTKGSGLARPARALPQEGRHWDHSTAGIPQDSEERKGERSSSCSDYVLQSHNIKLQQDFFLKLSLRNGLSQGCKREENRTKALTPALKLAKEDLKIHSSFTKN